MDDMMLMTVIGFFCVFGGFAIASAFYSTRLFEVQRRCIERVNDERRERQAAEQMVKDVAIREKIYGNVPVERLIRKDGE